MRAFFWNTSYQTVLCFAAETARRDRIQMASEIRAAVTCAIIVTLFSLAWLPYAIIALISTFGHPEIVTPYVNSLPALFAKTNTIYNPIVYALMNERFRNAVWSLLRLRQFQMPGNRRLSDFLRFSSPRGSTSEGFRIPGTRRRFSSRTTSISLATTPVSPTVPLFQHMQKSSFDENQEDNLGLSRDGSEREGPRRTSKEFCNGLVSIPSMITEERSSALRLTGSKPSLLED
nr:rhabdomeric opsin [Macrobiotus pallari]